MPKIQLLDVTVRNFGSFGNDETTFEYQPGINVVTGHVANSTRRNGIGKSTLLVDAASFAIYGKPLRGGKVKKGDLINDVNKKNCEVTLRVKVGSDVLKIIRKMKPNGLEVFINEDETPKKFDSMVNTQTWLEDKIGISHTCFANIMVLNINSSVPFLAMEKAGKREVMEDLLTLSIYGKMAEKARNRHLDAKSNMKDLETEFRSAVSSFEMAQESLQGIDVEREKFLNKKKNDIDQAKKEISDLKDSHEEIKNKTKWGDFEDKLEAFKKEEMDSIKRISELNSDIERAKEEIKKRKVVLEKLKGEPHCPLCHSSFDDDNEIAIKYIKECEEVVEEKTKIVETLNNDRDKEKVKKDKAVRNAEKAKKLINLQHDAKVQLGRIESSIQSKEKELSQIENREFEIGDVISKERLEQLEDEVKRTESEYNEAEKEFNNFRVIRKLLGEEGMRKFVVSKILPFLNSKINEHLKMMGADYTLTFDSNLEETILNKTREERPYTSLSSGEKKKIDISVLLSFMDVAKLQNSVDSNVLILDEVLDTSMDNDGVESFLRFLQNAFKKKYPDKCIYIITHRKEIADDSYDRLINLVKKKGFTTIESIIEF